MSAILPSQPYSRETPQASPSLRGGHRPAITGPELEQPTVLITGDLRLCVPESEATLHPITGHYRIEVGGMLEPFYMLWLAEGQVQRRQARSTSIAFDVRGACAGETRTYLVAVQVAESGVLCRVVLSGVFVQVIVTRDGPLSHSDWHQRSSQHE